jgi:23S rRNA pseudouridine2605 synthase
VVRIVRIRIASLLLGKLKPGEWRYLTMKEINHLRTSANLPKQDIDKKSSD